MLIARSDSLKLRRTPHTDAPTVTVPYRAGWKVIFDESIHRTIQSRTIVVKSTKSIAISCGGSMIYTFKKGEESEYLQYAAEGHGTARVGGKIWVVPFELEAETF